MSRSYDEQKRIESWFLAAARNAGVPIPQGELPDENPDFRFWTENRALGIELSEVLRPASTNYGIVPVEEESHHRRIIELAQRAYYNAPNTRPVHVNVYFTASRGKRSNQHEVDEIARALSEFVQENIHRANPTVILTFNDAPEGFDSVLIAADRSADWWNGECGGISMSEIRSQVETRIAEKDKRVDIYRSNLPAGAELWLLLHTGVTVAQSVPLPHDIEAWRIPTRFDKVFWFTALENQFAEIHKN